MKKVLEREMSELRMLINEVQADVKKLPKGKVHVSQSHGSYQYYLNGKYVKKKDKELIAAMICRDYYLDLLEKMRNNLSKLQIMENIYEQMNLDEVFHKLPKGKQKLITNSTYKTIQQRIEEFESETYAEYSQTHSIHTELYTVKGEHVRSKSEKIIADELYRRGIPYRYEKPLILMHKGRRIVLHPDITAMNIRTGRIVLLEHLGLLDNPGYAQNVANKLSLYEKNGYLIGRDLILLHESQEEPLNAHVLNEYIEEFLL